MSEKFTFFYGGPYSQWFDARFQIDGVWYNTTEQYMMASKARHFGDEETLAKIMATRHPREQKRLGRQVRNFDVAEWNRVSRDYVYKGNYAKFSQNAGLKQILIEETAGTTLVEASPTDKLWGIGLDAHDERAENRETWQGVNWLGEVLTKVRDDLAAGVETTENFGWSDSVHHYEAPPRI